MSAAAKRPRCTALRKDNSPCEVYVWKDGPTFSPYCHFHAVFQVASDLGYELSYSRQHKTFTAALGDRKLYSNDAVEMIGLMRTTIGKDQKPSRARPRRSSAVAG